ncbi:hypothetical protein QTI66_15205 [Variovorax sp. J22R133]|uniref:hypothetical protein n=1 Tax=Variovorax brevis TaxID=3053503 RepID=UPI0025766D5D|nr:hypothetical protein [Variovorax sp. J22R133]MDM0113506.1 hypothetical protein [Variovorax sp. J22R133]
MKMLLLAALAAAIVSSGCTTSNADVVLLKTLTGPARCTAPVNGACAGCETACPALKQALCVGGSTTAATDGTAAACAAPASCSCL